MEKAGFGGCLSRGGRARAAWVLALPLFAVPCQAASFVVDRSDDAPTATACTAAADDCSLRGAILAAANALAASASPEPSTISLPAARRSRTRPPAIPSSSTSWTSAER
jgi:hypothetical protein